jgi:hypothetical protein
LIFRAIDFQKTPAFLHVTKNMVSSPLANMLYKFVVCGDPIPKPRMTRADVWKLRPSVVQYRQWCDSVRRACTGERLLKVAEKICKVHAVFWMAPAASLSNPKKEKLYGQPHEIMPDLDNLIKGLCDALFDNDSMVSNISARKLYHVAGGIPCTVVSLSDSPFPFPTDLCQEIATR